ncbi:MAG: tetratricopeptide repeat protein [Pseudanabaenaceae cyanobacterium]
MNSQLAVIYLTILIGMLGGIGWLVVQQILKNRRQEQVIAELQPKLTKEKGSAEEYYQLGSVYLRKKLYAKAIAEFHKSLKDNPTPEAYNALGYAYFCQEQYDLAIKNYREALELEPNYLVALHNLAHAYEKKRLIPQAIATYEQALALNPKDNIAQRRLRALKPRV